MWIRRRPGRATTGTGGRPSCGCRRVPDAAAEADPPGHDQRVAGERDERAGPGDSQAIKQPPPVSSARRPRRSSPTITIAASWQRRDPAGPQRERLGQHVGRDRVVGDDGRMRRGAWRAGGRVDQVVREPAVAVTPRRRPNPDVATPCPSAGRRAGDRRRNERRRVASTRPRARPRAATRSPPASTRTDGSSDQPAKEARRPAGHPALGDSAEIEPRPCRDLRRAAADGRSCGRPSQPRAGRGSTRRTAGGRPGSGGTPRRPARRRPAAGRRRRCGGSSPSHASSRSSVSGDTSTGAAGRRVQARDVAVGAKRDQRGSSRSTAWRDRRPPGLRRRRRCGGSARWCRWRATPRRRSS